MPKKSELRGGGELKSMFGSGKKKMKEPAKLSLAQKVKKAKDEAYGTKQINVRKRPSIADEASTKKMPVNRNARILNKTGKVIKITSKQGVSGPYAEKATVRKVNLDAYDLLSKQAKASGLKGKEAEAAISKALGRVSTRMINDRQRTAARGKAIVNRDTKKRRSINLG
jgi:ElaB/YqjD/DUF883 family membrane-anchored ribosome-binding protein